MLIGPIAVTIALLLAGAVVVSSRGNGKTTIMQNKPISPEELQNMGIHPPADYREWYERWYWRMYWEGKL